MIIQSDKYIALCIDAYVTSTCIKVTEWPYKIEGREREEGGDKKEPSRG